MIRHVLFELYNLFAADCVNYNLLTAVLFIGPVSTIIVSITDPAHPWNAATRVSALELVRSARTFSCTRDEFFSTEKKFVKFVKF